MTPPTSRVREAYDTVADEYVRRISDELAGKPLDCALLDTFVKRVGPGARVCDVGCGPGHVARYLRDRGADVHGIDLSPGMVEAASRCHPDIRFETGDLRSLGGERDLAGAVAFYSLIHLPREEVAPALRGLQRRIVPGGVVFLAFHIGAEVVHLDEWWGRPVSVDFTFFELAEMRQYVTDAGFGLEWVIERAPYEGVEHPTRRGYILGRSE